MITWPTRFDTAAAWSMDNGARVRSGTSKRQLIVAATHPARNVLQCGRNELHNAQHNHDARDCTCVYRTHVSAPKHKTSAHTSKPRTNSVERGHDAACEVLVECEAKHDSGERLADAAEQAPLHCLPLAASRSIDGHSHGHALCDIRTRCVRGTSRRCGNEQRAPGMLCNAMAALTASPRPMHWVMYSKIVDRLCMSASPIGSSHTPVQQHTSGHRNQLRRVQWPPTCEHGIVHHQAFGEVVQAGPSNTTGTTA